MLGNCKQCVYFTFHKAGDPGGTCRRYPPQPLVLPVINQLSGQAQLTIQSAFPESLETQFCGEFSEKWLDHSGIQVSN